MSTRGLDPWHLDGHPGVDDVGFAFSLGCISGSWIGGVRDKFFKSQRYID